jgi:type I restriction enzyme, S subunit
MHRNVRVLPRVDEWQENKLEELLIDIQPGFARRPSEDGKVPHLRTNNINSEGKLDLSEIKYVKATENEVGKYSLAKGDVLFNNTNSDIWVGKTAYVDRDLDTLFSNHLTRLRVNKSKLHPQFLAIYLHKLQREGFFKAISTRWVNQTAVNTTALRNLSLRIPPVDEQRKIVVILNRTDTVKQIRTQANQLTDKIIQSVFLKMFGDREPQNTIGDVATFVSSGSTPLGGENTYVEKGVVFIREQNVLMNELDLQSVAHITEETHHKMRRTWVKNGDVLLNITGASLGRVAVYRGEDDRANVNQHVCIMRLDWKKAIPEYVSSYLSTSRGQKQIWTIQAGASRQALNFEQVKSLNLCLPDLKEQEKFVSYITRIDVLKASQKQGTQEINELFHSLMQKAFRGELVS